MNRIAAVLAAVLVSTANPIMALAQDSAKSSSVGQKKSSQRVELRVGLYVHEKVDRWNAHTHYAQESVVRWARRFGAPSRLSYYEVDVFTSCEWETEDPRSAFRSPP